MDIDKFGSATPFQWNHDHLIQVLTQGNDPILTDPLIINAFKNVAREDFVQEIQKQEAYQDKQIEINEYESLNQPTVVAKMLKLLHPQAGKKFLDIGTGSGYVAALLGHIAGANGKVFSLERNQFIAQYARDNIEKYPNLKTIVEIIFKNASEGYAEQAPFDYIHSSVSFPQVPKVIQNQLVVGGRMIVPTVNNELVLIERVSPTEFAEQKFPGFIMDKIKEGVE